MLKPLSACEPLARVLRVPNIHVYSVFAVCSIMYVRELRCLMLLCPVPTFFMWFCGQRMCWLLLKQERSCCYVCSRLLSKCNPTLNILNITGVTEAEAFYDSFRFEIIVRQFRTSEQVVKTGVSCVVRFTTKFFTKILYNGAEITLLRSKGQLRSSSTNLWIVILRAPTVWTLQTKRAINVNV